MKAPSRAYSEGEAYSHAPVTTVGGPSTISRPRSARRLLLGAACGEWHQLRPRT